MKILLLLLLTLMPANPTNANAMYSAANDSSSAKKDGGLLEVLAL